MEMANGKYKFKKNNAKHTTIENCFFDHKENKMRKLKTVFYETF